jgi:hypothetical protein
MIPANGFIRYITPYSNLELWFDAIGYQPGEAGDKLMVATVFDAATDALRELANSLLNRTA